MKKRSPPQQQVSSGTVLLQLATLNWPCFASYTKPSTQIAFKISLSLSRSQTTQSSTINWTLPSAICSIEHRFIERSINKLAGNKWQLNRIKQKVSHSSGVFASLQQTICLSNRFTSPPKSRQRQTADSPIVGSAAIRFNGEQTQYQTGKLPRAPGD